MKLSCLQENLNKGLAVTGRVITTRGSLPILENILFKTEGGRLKLVATNLEVGIVYWVGAKVEKEGSITIPARLISEYVSSLPPKKVNIEAKELNLNVKSEKYEANIKGIGAEDFPLIPEIKEKPLVICDAEGLAQGISQVAFAAAIDESRPVLSGVYVVISKDEMKLVATDSYRLAEKTIKLKEKAASDKKFVVPARAMQELERVLADVGGKVEISVGENQVLFHTENVDVSSRMIEENFPDYEQIIPDSSETQAVVSTKDFINIVKTASLFARESANNIKIQLKSQGEIVVSANTAQVGDNVSIADAKISGPSGEIAFNARYLLDVLNNVNKDEVTLGISGKLSPGVINPKDGKDYTYIIMPLRT